MTAIHRDYPCNIQNYQGGRVQPVSFLVLHYVGALGDAEQNAWYYHSTPGIKASAHYFVDHASEGAEIWSSVPEDCVASHCGRSDGKYKHPQCRNANSIGIEMCCHQRADGTWYIDPETVDAAVELSRDIIARYGIPIDHVLRHFDVTGKSCPMPWVENPREWETFKARLEDDMTQEQFNKMFAAAMAEYEAEQARKPVAEWAKEHQDWAMGQGITDGARPCATMTRQEEWTMAHRLFELGGGAGGSAGGRGAYGGGGDAGGIGADGGHGGSGGGGANREGV